jgi:hypothetical protein
MGFIEYQHVIKPTSGGWSEIQLLMQPQTMTP